MSNDLRSRLSNRFSDVGISMVNYMTAEQTATVAMTLVRILRGCQVVIVDNSESTDQLERLRQAESVQAITVLDPGTNLGYAKGHNRAISALRANEKGLNVVIVINADIVIDSSFVAFVDRARGFLEARTSVVAVGPRVTSVWHPRAHTPKLPQRPPVSLALNLCYPFGWLVEQAWQTVNSVVPPWATIKSCLMGSCLAVNADRFVQIGGFDPRTFLYFEEDLLRVRAEKHGYTMLYDPAVRVRHGGDGSVRASAITWRKVNGWRANSYRHLVQTEARSDWLDQACVSSYHRRSAIAALLRGAV